MMEVVDLFAAKNPLTITYSNYIRGLRVFLVDVSLMKIGYADILTWKPDEHDLYTDYFVQPSKNLKIRPMNEDLEVFSDVDGYKIYNRVGVKVDDFR